MKKGYKLCPFCCEEIREKAIKCMYCGEFLPEEEKEESKKKVKKEKKECQFCMNKVDVDATTCPFCDERLDSNDTNEKITNDEVFDESKIKKAKEEDLTPKEIAIKKSIKKINTAFGIQCCCFVGTLLVYLWQFTESGEYILGKHTGINIYIIDVLISGIFAYFIFKRNRMATIFAFIYYVLSSILVLANSNKRGSAFNIRFLFSIGLFIGIIGSFRYHSLTNQKKLSKSEKILLVGGIIITLLLIMGLFYKL